MGGCLDIAVTRASSAPEITCEHFDGPEISASRVSSPIECDCVRVGEPAVIAAYRKDKDLELRCSLVCTTSSEFYLIVPMETVWLTPDNDFSEDVEVIANVIWTIE